ncbi:hypothetical protein [Bythopirellula goksoeyrii]|uniref:Uncharacterized protein n=1 Tax=Bythopirellula goksoeyrii TaxID=1400387 RepID=A0A5B9QUY4_9BACT|nr:hypothetical protein [Bythopirellula goksoeyrii]QEG37811.1 hypothetical protein Pr1d_51580 [Bythopirellula goksoeyrii]
MNTKATRSFQAAYLASAIVALFVSPLLAREPIAWESSNRAMETKGQSSIEGFDYPCLNMVKFDLESTASKHIQTHEIDIVLIPNRESSEGKLLPLECADPLSIRAIGLLEEIDLFDFSDIVDAQPSSLISIDCVDNRLEMPNGGAKIVNMPAVLTIQ